MLSKLVQETLRNVKEALQEMPGETLPPLRKMASDFRVSWPIMSQVLDQLVQEGVVERHRGRRTRRVNTNPGQLRKISPGAADERLADEFRGKIKKGELLIGDTLPKILFLSAKEKLSNHTVSSAYNILISENLAHRDGKRFVVGAQTRPAIRMAHFRQAIVLILCQKASLWEGICVSTRTGLFGSAFNREKIKLNVRLVHVPVLFEDGFEKNVAIKLAEINKENRNQYLGSLLVDDGENPIHMLTLAYLLEKYHRPVVWFDRNDLGQNLTKRPGRHFYRCHFNEYKAAQAAIRYLFETGHSRVCYTFMKGVPWHEKRMSLLVKASKDFPGLKLFSSQEFVIEDFKMGNPLIDISLELVERNNLNPLCIHLDEALRFASKIRQKLKDWIPSTARESKYQLLHALILKHHGEPEVHSESERHVARSLWAILGLREAVMENVSALIAPNDATARGHHYDWLTDLKIQMPNEMSIISFDYSFRTSLFSLTSVDMGFENLGYLAFHAIVGDIPIESDAMGNISASPFVADNGTVLFRS